MGKCLKIFLVTSALLVVMLGYMLHVPLPDYMAESWKTRLMMMKMGAAFLSGPVGEFVGLGSSLNISRNAFITFFSDPATFEPIAKDLQVTDTTMEGVPVRIYKPKGVKEPMSALVYYHGGGWVLLNVDAYDTPLGNIAKENRMIVVSVEYRLAPEHPFPAGFDDCAAVTRHMLRQGSKYGVDTKKIAIGGDSAGGNLAAAVAIKLRDEKIQPPVKAQVLIYGAFSFCNFDTPIYYERALVEGTDDAKEQFGYFIAMWHNFTDAQKGHLIARRHTPEFNQKCEKLNNVDLIPAEFILKGFQRFKYPKCDVDEDVKFVSARMSDPRVSPALADSLKNLPAAYVMSAQWDFIRDDSIFYVKRLQEAGVKVEWFHLPDSFHGVFSFSVGDNAFENGRKTMKSILKFLKSTL